MKKEFKAPTIETKQLFAQDSVMAYGDIKMFTSAGQNPEGLSTMSDTEVTDQFKQWKGFGSN